MCAIAQQLERGQLTPKEWAAMDDKGCEDAERHFVKVTAQHLQHLKTSKEVEIGDEDLATSALTTALIPMHACAIREFCGDLGIMVESPIELLFGLAFGMLVLENADGLVLRAPEGHVSRINRGMIQLHDAVLQPQATIGDFRVDFLIEIEKETFEGRARASLIVECDGHDFHEKTKEQARRDKARDRTLQTCGFPVFRFTGAEIWGDPINCASQVREKLDKDLDSKLRLISERKSG